MNRVHLFGRIAGAFALALLPIAAHLVPHFLGSAFLFNSTAAFVSAHGVCGFVAGAAFGFLALPAAPVAYIAAMVFLTAFGFVGGGGDGDLFYVVALFGDLAFLAASVAGAVARPFFVRGAAGSKPG